MLEPAREEDDLSAAPVPVLAGQPDQPDHLLQRLVGGVHEGLLADLAAVQRLAAATAGRRRAVSSTVGGVGPGSQGNCAHGAVQTQGIKDTSSRVSVGERSAPRASAPNALCEIWG